MKEDFTIILIILVIGLLVEIMFINIKDKDHFLMSPIVFALLINILYILYNLIKWYKGK